MPFMVPHVPQQGPPGSVIPTMPALHLYPLNDSFMPKQISLAQGKVRIGRQTNAKTVPGERNGYFDSKVLSRMHAEVWEDSGKILIKDVKSSNGTFINSERLSPEGVESEPFELKSDDIVEFGIDIVGEDNKTIIHHKVAAKVFCILTPDDVLASQREMQYYRNPGNRLPHPVIGGGGGGPGGPGAGGPNGAGVGGHPGNQPNGQPGNQMGQQQSGQQQPPQGQTLGGMGSSRAPGKSGLTFDHLLSRLQSEIVKSRETGQDLGMVGRDMGEIGETLSGGLPHHPPPPPPQPSHRDSATSTMAITTLQSQLHETRASLQTHAEKVRSLESLLAEHDALKREVAGMREVMEESRHIVEVWRREKDGSASTSGSASDEQMNGTAESDVDDDAKSVLTIVPDDMEGERDERDEHHEDAEHEGEREMQERREEVGRPGTPEPTGHGLDDDDLPSDPVSEAAPSSPPRPTINGFAHETDDSPPSPSTNLPPLPASPPSQHQELPTESVVDYISRDEFAERFNTLMAQFSDMTSQLAATRTHVKELAAQQAVIRTLEERLAGWEEWKRSVEERIGGVDGRVGGLEGWKEEEQRKREIELAWEDESEGKLYTLVEGEAEGAGSSEEAVPIGPPPPVRAARRRRRSKQRNGSAHPVGIIASGLSKSPRNTSPHDAQSTGSSSSSSSRSSGSSRRSTSTKPSSASTRGRSESQSTAVGSDGLPHSKQGSFDTEDERTKLGLGVLEGDATVTDLASRQQHEHKPHPARDASVSSIASSSPSNSLTHFLLLCLCALALSSGYQIGFVLLPVAATAVIVGIAAWALVNRVKD